MRTMLLAAVAASLFATSAYASTTTPYQPAAATKGKYGYAETQLDANRLRVTFTGKTGSTRDMVENNLLYRSAETTLQRGYTHFLVVYHTVDRSSEFESFGPPIGSHRSYQEDVKFTATSDILMIKSPPLAVQPANMFDARSLQTNLGTQIVRPKR